MDIFQEIFLFLKNPRELRLVSREFNYIVLNTQYFKQYYLAPGSYYDWLLFPNNAIDIICEHRLLNYLQTQPEWTIVTIFYGACERGYVDMIESLASQLPEIYIKSGFIKSARCGQLSIIECLISKIDPSCQCNAAIDWAAENGHILVVERLLQDPRVTRCPLNTALAYASWKGHYDIVLLLINLSNNIEHAFNMAARYGHENIVELFMSRNLPKNTAFLNACRRGHSSIVDRLIEVPCKTLNKGLQIAARRGDFAIANRLMLAGAILPEALIDASKHGHLEIVNLILEKLGAGALPEITTKAFIESCQSGHLAVVQQLHRYVDPGARNNRAITVAGCLDIVNYLLQDPRVYPVEKAIIHAIKVNILVVERLLQDPRVNIRNLSYKVICQAARRGHIPLIKRLYKAGLETTQALLAAIKANQLDVVIWFLAHSVDPTANDNESVIYACRFGNIEIVKLLLQAGADPTARNNKSIIYACRIENIEIVKLLLQAGADPSVMNNATVITSPAIMNVLRAHPKFHQI